MTSVSSTAPGPLNPGNVVSAALRIYRDRFKTYLGLAARAYLWLLVPIYGWAKYAMHLGLISRLAFKEVTNEPETTKEAYQAVQPKMWSFLGLGFILGLAFIGAYLAIALAAILAGFIVAFALGALLSLAAGPIGASIGGVLGALVGFAVLLFGLLWIVGRLFIPEVPLAVELGVDATTSISRSWNLSKSSIVRIQFVVLAAYLITIPAAIVSIIPQFALLGLEPGSATYSLVYGLLLILSFVSGIFVLPFWQVVKGVLYYDLRSRREGLDLKITDSNKGDEFI